MRARVTDWALLGFTLLAVGTGLWSFLMGEPNGRWLFVTHGAIGLAVVGVLAIKLRRVTPKLRTSKGWSVSSLVGILTAVAVLCAIGTGIWWVVMQSPIHYPNGMILHTTAGFVLLALCLWHLMLRYRPLRSSDLQNRRSMLRLMSLLLGGSALWAGIEAVQPVVGTPGSRRRFTGSRQHAGALPVTMWMFDTPLPIQPEQYVLTVTGAVENPLRLGLAEVAELPVSSITATLDCTGGWYSEQHWQGIQVGELIARAVPAASARFVRFRSVTGYRWSLPWDEALTSVLALQVGGATLSHGNGAPLRLVAPGRRGFQWVKWVVAVEVLEEVDIGQWGAIFTSGLDRNQRT